MLYQLLQEIKSAPEPLNLAELAYRLKVEPAALNGMIDFLVKKGRLQRDQVTCATDQPNGACGACACSAGCMLAGKIPSTYSFPAKSHFPPSTTS